MDERYAVGLQGMADCNAAGPRPHAEMDPIGAARGVHDRARNRYSSTMDALRAARKTVAHLEHDAYIDEHALHEANGALVRALRNGA